MKLIKLLLLLVLPFGPLVFACGTSTMTYQNGGQTNTSSSPCPSGSNPSGPPPVSNTQATTYSTAAKAAEDAAKTAAKKACQETVAAQVATDTKACNAEVDYKAALQNQACLRATLPDEFSWSFSFSGRIFSMSTDLAPIKYSSVATRNYECSAYTNASVALTKSYCETTGESTKNQACNFN